MTPRKPINQDDVPESLPDMEWDPKDSTATGVNESEPSVEALLKERDELADKLLRAQAECANIARRLSQQHAQERRHAATGLAKAMLPILDGLERMLKSIEESGRTDPIAEGVQLLRDQFESALRQNGIEPIESLGKPFNPELHEAVMQDPNSDQPPGTVIREYERGYRLHDRVLRHAKVVVSAKNDQ